MTYKGEMPKNVETEKKLDSDSDQEDSQVPDVGQPPAGDSSVLGKDQ